MLFYHFYCMLFRIKTYFNNISEYFFFKLLILNLLENFVNITHDVDALIWGRRHLIPFFNTLNMAMHPSYISFFLS